MGAFLTPPPAPQAVVIMNDGGGEVRNYEWAVNKYNAEHRRVEIRGSCRSACTMALGVKNVCVAPGAVLKWHQAYEKFTGAVREDITQSMLSQLPYRVRNHLEGKIQTNYTSSSTLSYTQLVSLGIKPCESKPVYEAADRPSVTWGGIFPLLQWNLGH